MTEWFDYSNDPPKFYRSSVSGSQEKKDEFETFWEIWQERPHLSEVSGEPLGNDFKIHYFSHILPKGQYNRFRCRKDNIMLMTFEEHQLWENHKHKIKNEPQWEKVFERFEKLKKEYYE